VPLTASTRKVNDEMGHDVARDGTPYFFFHAQDRAKRRPQVFDTLYEIALVNVVLVLGVSKIQVRPCKICVVLIGAMSLQVPYCTETCQI
jgi:hypothetical protein